MKSQNFENSYLFQLEGGEPLESTTTTTTTTLEDATDPVTTPGTCQLGADLAKLGDLTWYADGATGGNCDLPWSNMESTGHFGFR